MLHSYQKDWDLYEAPNRIVWPRSSPRKPLQHSEYCIYEYATFIVSVLFSFVILS